MNSKIIFALCTLFSLAVLPVMAQEESLLQITTDDKSYVGGDTIVISGSVSTVIVGEPVTLQIFHKGNVVDIAQFDVAEDGSFTHTVLAEGPLWANEGDYLARAYYGGHISETEFNFITKKEIPETTDIFEVDAGEFGTFDVEYTIRGGEVKDMLVDHDIFALIVIIESDDDGTISLDLPRESIDAKKQGGGDDTFIILIDGMEVPYQESITNDDSRVITINFEEGDSDIEIIGTFVIPEFGVIVSLVLVAGITTTILFSRKAQLRV